MINIKDKSMCCGCQACLNICPKNIIKMECDEKGFKYPKVNTEECINCGLCEKVCPIMNSKTMNNSPKAYACINKNEEIRLKSTSGGIFTLLASNIISDGGVVFGACFNDELGVHHTYCYKIEDLKNFRGSKYLQSDVGLSYRKVKEFLLQGRKVLFTGTPCQIAALKSYLGREHDNLYLQDIICHGVPSPLVWKKYKEYREEKAKSKLKNMSFRSKKNTTWLNYNIDMEFSNNTSYVKQHTDDSYMKAFLSHLSLRESCTDCKFKKNNRLSDITLADFWGIQNINPNFDDGKGTSLVIVNSTKGQELFEKIKNEILCEEVEFEKAIRENPSFNTVSKANPNADNFYEDLKNGKDFEKIVNKYSDKVSLIKKAIRKAKRIIKK